MLRVYKTTVEYALQGMQKPIEVSTYRLNQALPERLQANLPTVEQLAQDLSRAVE
jgi:hypothetical protein